MNIMVNDGECFVCGTLMDLTMHHTIPKHMNPKKNVVVPVCSVCHDKINQTDLNSMQAFAFKIHKSVDSLTAQLTELNRLIDAVRKHNEAKKKVLK